MGAAEADGIIINCRIKDSLHVGRIQVSEAFLTESEANPRWTQGGGPEEMQFDDQGNLLPIG